MTWIADSRFSRSAPRLQQGTNLGALPLSPEEGFVLSRVDGTSTVEEICLIAGLPKERTLEILAKLHQIGVLDVPGAPAPLATKATMASASPLAAQAASGEVTPTPATSAPQVLPATPITAPELPVATPAAAFSGPPFVPDPGCNLSEDKQRAIHELYFSIEELDFYSLLGLEVGCDAKGVQRAFRKISLKYHPDRFFGKSLGVCKERLETIFRHVSNVAEYLTDDAQRASYEAELPCGAPEEPQGEPVEGGSAPHGTGYADSAPATTGPAAMGTAASSSGGRDAGEPSTDELEALGRPRQMSREQRLRRLGGVLGMSTQALAAVARGRRTPTPQGVPELSPERRARLRDSERGATRKTLSPVILRKRKAQEYYDEGVKAMLAGNWPTAASSLKLATTFDPKNQEYREKEQVASQRARQLSSETYAKHAAFEESIGHHEEAARLFTMAADRQESIDLLTRAANSLARTGELKRAMEYAMKAKDLNPNSVPARLSLANAYLAAGMPKNARREVDYVLRLDSENQAAKALLREIRKAD